MSETNNTHHVLSVLVENRFGVLTRIAGLFARRGFNIYSLAVSPTDNPRFSRMTIVVDAESTPLEQVSKQLHKLINVIKINEIEAGAGVEQELLMVTVKASPEQRAQVTDLAAIFSARIIDVGHHAMTLSAAGTPDQLDALMDLLHPFGVADHQRTGRIALPKLARQSTAVRAVASQSA